MEIIIFFLVILLIFCCIQIKEIKSLSKKEKENHLKIIEQNEKLYQSALSEKNKILKKKVECDEKISKLEKELEQVKRKLDFYKNIEKDSGKLNSEPEKEDRKQLVEEAVSFLRNRQNKGEDLGVSAKTLGSLLDDEQASIWNEIEGQQKNYFITGKAGTGKSFLLDVFRKATNKKHIVLAPTGIAALNVGGATLHSTFGYDNLVKLDVDMISTETIRLKSEKKLILKNVETIIIDEISMVRADIFEKIDKILRAINQNEQSFGGKQMLLFGDLFQLPPIAKPKEWEYLLDRYNGVHFFASEAFKQGDFVFRELTVNHRQKEDSDYFDLLNRVRDGTSTTEDINVLNSRVVQDESIYDRFTSLLPTKAEVERLNKYHIEQLDSPKYTYQAKIVFDKYPNNNRSIEAVFPITSSLTLKKGALVMMVSNDLEHRWVNGTLGIVNTLSEKGISISINERTYDIQPIVFTEQEVIYEDGRIVYEDVLKVEQYPIALAYAITIHKSQGQTYKNIVCDINKCFADGQAYVALSRCSSLGGLHLKEKVSNADIHVDKNVLEFYQRQKSNLNP